MAKRFTDSEKWKKTWFRSLSAKEKLIWIYLLDDCDHAGIWFGDFDLMSFQLGFKVIEKDLSPFLEKQMSKYGNKYLINDFFVFQYGKNIEGIKAKERALERIKELMNQPLPNPYPTLTEGLPNPLSISISTSISKKGGVGGDENDSQQLYSDYPKKVGKKAGFAKLKTILKKEGNFDKLKIAIANYKTKLAKDSTDPKYIKHFDTFLSSWEDWLDPTTGTFEELRPVYEPTFEPGEWPGGR